MRKLSPFSQERLRVHLLENHGRKSPTKGETLWQFQAPVRAREPPRIISHRTSRLASGGPCAEAPEKGPKPLGEAGRNRQGRACLGRLLCLAEQTLT